MPAQANKVAAWLGQGDASIGQRSWGAIIGNDSDLPITSLRVFFYSISAVNVASVAWGAVDRGGPDFVRKIWDLAPIS
jgi:hypothetical protein